MQVAPITKGSRKVRYTENATPAAEPASRATRDQSARRPEPRRAAAQAASTTA